MPFHSIFVHMKPPPYCLQTSHKLAPLGVGIGMADAVADDTVVSTLYGAAGNEDVEIPYISQLLCPLVEAGRGMWVLHFVCVVFTSTLLSVASQPCRVWPLSCHHHKRKGTLDKIRRVHRHTAGQSLCENMDLRDIACTLRTFGDQATHWLGHRKFNCALNCIELCSKTHWIGMTFLA